MTSLHTHHGYQTDTPASGSMSYQAQNQGFSSDSSDSDEGPEDRLSAYYRQQNRHDPDLPPAYDSSPMSFPSPYRNPPFYLDLPKLNKIIAIPSTKPALGSPFMRAYPPVLHQYGLPNEVFIPFLDHVNRAAVASPPIQLLSLAGDAVSLVPEPTAQIVGAAVNAAAEIGLKAVSKGRVEMILQQANREVFGPRGLKVNVGKMDAVAALAKIPILLPDGKIDKSAPVLRPFERGEDIGALSVQERRLQALAPWIADLEAEGIPDLEQHTNVLSKMHADASEKQRKKEEAKLIKSRYKREKKMAKREAKGKQPKAEAKGKEEKSLRKLFFLVVTNRDGTVGEM